MKTVEIVKMAKGYYVTRRYYGMNHGGEFFTTVAPSDMGTRKAKKFLEEVEQKRLNYIKEWVGE